MENRIPVWSCILLVMGVHFCWVRAMSTKDLLGLALDLLIGTSLFTSLIWNISSYLFSQIHSYDVPLHADNGGAGGWLMANKMSLDTLSNNLNHWKRKAPFFMVYINGLYTLNDNFLEYLYKILHIKKKQFYMDQSDSDLFHIGVRFLVEKKAILLCLNNNFNAHDYIEREGGSKESNNRVPREQAHCGVAQIFVFCPSKLSLLF